MLESNIYSYAYITPSGQVTRRCITLYGRDIINSYGVCFQKIVDFTYK